MSTTHFEAPSETAFEFETKAAQKLQSSKIATLLRGCGSILIIFSALSFLLQGVDGIAPAYRYWVALGLIIILSLGGVICAYGLKESKGARLFFALASAFLAVQISQLGAMLHGYLYGQMFLDEQQFFSWWQFGHVTLLALLLNLFATVVISAPVVFTAFSLLARKQRKLLSSTFVIANLALLIPFRDATITPFIIFGLLLYLRHVNHSLSRDSSVRLFEGVIARIIIWVPALLMIGRSFLYPVSSLFPTLILVFISLWLIVDVKKATTSKKIIFSAELLGVSFALMAGFCIIGKFESQIQTIILLLPISLLLFFLSEQLTYNNRLYRTVASLLAAIVCSSLELTGSITPLISISSGLLLMIAAIKYREKVHVITGTVCFVSGMVYYFHYLMYFYQASPWLSSIGLGLVVLLLASYIESREKQIIQKSRAYYQELKAWH